MGAYDCLHAKWTWMCMYKHIYAHAWSLKDNLRYVASQVLSSFCETRVSHWPRTHLIQLPCSVSKLRGSSQISPRLQGPGTTPSFFFFLFSFIDTGELIQILVLAQEVLYWLSLCSCLMGQGFQQFRLVLNSLYSQGRIRTPDPLTSNCQKMLGL